MLFFENSPNMAPVKGGLGGSPNDISDVMQGSIYAYILCMALACRMYYDIYITTMKSKALRGDPTRRIGKAEAFAAANLQDTASAADLPFGNGGFAGAAGPRT